MWFCLTLARARKGVRVAVCVCVWERESVCVCVGEREIVRERAAVPAKAPGAARLHLSAESVAC